MGALALMAMLSGMMLSVMDLTDDDNPADDAETEPENPEEPEGVADTGASFIQTDNRVELELGDDETGSLAVFYFTDTQDNPDDFVLTDEARFYLVPEGVDWSEATWETQTDIPGYPEFGGPPQNYGLEEFEDQFGLELLGTVDLKGVPSDTDDPGDRVGEIVSNQPVAGYYVEANTDGDDLVSFLPQDFVVTYQGVPQTSVSEDTTGTAATDWIAADADGITVNGGEGDDFLETDNADVTLLGGAGDDRIESSGTDVTVDGGAGDDTITSDYGTVDGGDGNDRVTMLSGTANGGEGNDRLVNYSDGPTQLNGGNGNDSITVSGADSEGYGGAGDDFLGTRLGATGYGGLGDDRFQLDSGTTGVGGAGDDLFEVWNQFRDPDGPAVVTGGEGADTIDARVWNPVRGEADDIYLRITDFDPDEDVLQVGSFGDTHKVNQIEIIEADDDSHTDIRIRYSVQAGSGPAAIAVIRLDGTPGLTADHIVITS